MSRNGRKTSVILHLANTVGGIVSIMAFIVSRAERAEVKYVDWPSVAIAAYILFFFAVQVYLLRIWFENRGDTDRPTEKAAAQNKKDPKPKITAKTPEQKVKSYEEAIFALHSLSHVVRNSLAGMPKHPGRISAEIFEAFAQRAVDGFWAIMKPMTAGSCATCIKVYSEETGEMVTVIRDCVSYAERGLVDNHRVTSVKGNSASESIIIGGAKSFFCNDLEALESEGRYENDRPDWKSCYRSTIVLPIRFYNPKTQKMHIFGLLCVDSTEPNAFDRDVSIQIGACVTDMIYPLFMRVDKGILQLHR